MGRLRRYTKEFKEDAVKYVEAHPEMKIQAVADYLGIPKETLYDWVKTYRRQLRAGETPPLGNLTEEERRIAQLERENRDLKDAIEVLKKAISILND